MGTEKQVTVLGLAWTAPPRSR